jgi:hypothetical protein
LKTLQTEFLEQAMIIIDREKVKGVKRVCPKKTAVRYVRPFHRSTENSSLALAKRAGRGRWNPAAPDA